MNEREFLRKLNKDGNNTLIIISKLLEEEKSFKSNEGHNRLFSLWRRIVKEKSAEQIIQDNFEDILERIDVEQLGDLRRMLKESGISLQVIKNNLGSILEKFNSIQNQSDYEYYHIDRTLFLLDCIIMPGARDVLVQHMDSIIQRGVNLREIKILRGLSKETDKKLNDKLEMEKESIIREMLIDGLGVRYINEDSKIIENYILTVKIMVERLLKSEKVRMIDITEIGVDEGAYSKVYQIGEKVLKIGKPRKTYHIPNHPRILQPLTRINLMNEKKHNRILGCIEISDRVEALSRKEMQEEQLYKVYKELRDDGIIWTDARFSNVGKLKRENTPSLNGEAVDVNPQAVGMDRKVNVKKLKIGDWVVLDTDYIYDQNDKQIIWVENSRSIDYERRWQQERQAEIAKEHRNYKKATIQENDKEIVE